MSTTPSGPRRPSNSSSGSSSQQSQCKVCRKQVYSADPQINIDGLLFHKHCAKCADCNCQITIDNFAKSEAQDGTSVTLYCSVHYLKRFAESGGAYLEGDRFQRKSERDTHSADALKQAASPSYRSVDGLIVNDIPEGLSYDQFANNFNESMALLHNSSSSAGAVDFPEEAAKLEERRQTLANAAAAAAATTSVKRDSISSDFPEDAVKLEARRKSLYPLGESVVVIAPSPSSAAPVSSTVLPPPPPPPSPLIEGLVVANQLGFNLSPAPEATDKTRTGTFVGCEGSKVEGSFSHSGLMEGYCRVELKNGSVYEGQMSKSKFEGRGKLVSCHGYSYEGFFRDGRFNGAGRYVSFDGAVMEGEFVDDVCVRKICHQ